MARLHELAGRYLGENAAEAEVAIGSRPTAARGWPRWSLPGMSLYAVNPLQASRYRERHGVSGAKSDRGDAHMLADMVRTAAHQLRRVAADSEDAEGVKVAARAHQTMIWERTRHLLRLRTGCASTSPPRWRR